jgi:hypothetical protein
MAAWVVPLTCTLLSPSIYQDLPRDGLGLLTLGPDNGGHAAAWQFLGADHFDRVPPQGVPRGQLAGAQAGHHGAGEDAGKHLPGQVRDGGLGDGEAERHHRRGRDRQPHQHTEADHGQGFDADHPGHLPGGGPDQAKQRQLAGALAGGHHEAVGGRDGDEGQQHADHEVVHPAVHPGLLGVGGLDGGPVHDVQTGGAIGELRQVRIERGGVGSVGEADQHPGVHRDRHVRHDSIAREHELSEPEVRGVGRHDPQRGLLAVAEPQRDRVADPDAEGSRAVHRDGDPVPGQRRERALRTPRSRVRSMPCGGIPTAGRNSKVRPSNSR